MQFLRDIFNIFYPPLCTACEQVLQTDEKYICLECRITLPRTRFHEEKGNKVEQVFYGRVPVYRASAWLYFQKGGKVQQLMHNIKYRGIKESAYKAGLWFGHDLQGCTDIASADHIMPVPLHKSKLRSRGFNQSEWLAKGLAEALNIPVDTAHLIRTRKTESQTKKTREERQDNVKDVFALEEAERFNGSHIILVDDVITTGATLEACARTILAVTCGAKISVLTLAVADS